LRRAIPVAQKRSRSKQAAGTQRKHSQRTVRAEKERESAEEEEECCCKPGEGRPYITETEGFIFDERRETNATYLSCDDDTNLFIVRHLATVLKEFDLTEVLLDTGHKRFRVRKGIATPATAPVIPAPLVTAPPASAQPQPETQGAPQPASAAAGLVEITSPFVGTFYRAPRPDAPPYVEVGSTIRPGQVLCIVEAMKLMNEIESEVAGTIVEICVQNGQPVEYGEVLFRVRPA